MDGEGVAALVAFAKAFFSRVRRLISSGTGAYEQLRLERWQLRHGLPPQQRIFLQERQR